MCGITQNSQFHKVSHQYKNISQLLIIKFPVSFPAILWIIYSVYISAATALVLRYILLTTQHLSDTHQYSESSQSRWCVVWQISADISVGPIYQTTQRHISEECHFNIHYCENLRPHTWMGIIHLCYCSTKKNNASNGKCLLTLWMHNSPLCSWLRIDFSYSTR